MKDSDDLDLERPEEIAVVGLAGRFPGAGSVEELWDNLDAGKESIAVFADEELLAAGIDPALLANPAYVKAGGVLAGIESFDAELFGMTPKEAEITDPQLRLFLECAWEALENAGYEPTRYPGAVGVFAGCSQSRYLITLLSNPAVLETVGTFRVQMSNEKDFLPTWVSYKLNLRGPSLAVQTACSTSLVAVHVASQSLLQHECDMALAGGVSVRFLRKAGYLHQEGGINSPDGHCRAFDAEARGTVSGDGAGVVVLKRLSDALADGDSIHAVIKGSAVNNDGGLKPGFTAPSVDGQARVIAEALAVAGVAPEEVRYVEAHGTGTSLGDPIEVAALTRAFRTAARGTCALGSVKTNIGHLDAAAGIAGLLKAIGVLRRRVIPPSLHFRVANPAIDFENSPFYVSARREECPPGAPLYAGVSSFGIGGTNAHMVLAEAPPAPAMAARDTAEGCLLPLAAHTPEALAAAAARLAGHLRRQVDLGREPDLRDVAYTLQVGRRAFEHRRVIVAPSVAEVLAELEGRQPPGTAAAPVEVREREVVFLFSGQGAQYAGMAAGLYAGEPAFRREVDRCAELFRPHLGLDLRTPLFPPADRLEEAQARLERTALAQAALFTVEHALARLWMGWGIKPAAMLGHSLGEYTAACLAGVFSLADAVALVAVRGQLMEQAPEGAMLSVPLSPEEVAPLLGADLWLAAVNGPSVCVVSGTNAAIAALERTLDGRGLQARRLKTSHAFHSGLMEPAVGPFLARLEEVSLQPPRIPFVSNVTGDWIQPAEATRPGYWAEHLRRPVQFDRGLATVLARPDRILLEAGPGSTLVTLARRHPDCAADQVVLPSLRHPQDEAADRAFLLGTLGRLWLAGQPVDWAALHAGAGRRRVPLPTYPFQRRRHWVEASRSAGRSPAPRREADVAGWLYRPSWKRSGTLPAAAPEIPAERWLVFVDEAGLGERLAQRLESAGHSVVTAAPGDDGVELLRGLERREWKPQRVLHLASLTRDGGVAADAGLFAARQEAGLHSLLRFAQALEAVSWTDPLRILVAANGLHAVTGEEELAPEKATLLGPCRVIPQEYPYLACRSVDVVLPPAGEAGDELALGQILAECGEPDADSTVAWRGRYRWVRTFERIPETAPRRAAPLRDRAVVLVTGGLGEVGLALAEHLARTARARLVLTRRSPFPPPETWDGWLAGYGEADPVSRKIRKLREIEALGAEVEVAAVDVADAEAMRRLLARVEARFGALHGVIHAAGSIGPQAFRPVGETGPEELAAQLRPKAEGLQVLAGLLAGRELDFWLLTSSLSAVLGGLGFAAYAAANCFLDAFAERQLLRGAGRWISVDWDGWRVGESAGEPGDGGLAIRPAEGREAFDRILALAEGGQVVVSTADLQARAAAGAGPRALTDSPAGAAESAGGVPAAPRPEGGAGPEETVARLWRDLLGIETIGPRDNFFKLGGDSLLATQLVAKLRQATGAAVPLRAVFETPTLAELAAVVAATVAVGRAGAARQRPPMVPVPRDRELPLSFSQQRLWFLEQLESDAPPYNTFSALHLDGRLDAAALERSVGEIVRRHEALRTVFPAVEGRPVQAVLPATGFVLPRVDLRGLPRATRDAEAGRLAARAAAQRFDLARGPLLQVALLAVGESEHALLIAMHHIICDGWSIGIFTRELPALYQAFSAGAPSPLPELPVQYADYAVWQRGWLQGEVLEGQLAYWRHQLAGLSDDLDFPLDHPRPARQTFRGAVEPFSLSLSLSRSLQEMGQRLDATLFMVLLAGFQVLLYRYTGQEDVAVGTNVANRTCAEVEGLIGFFVNNLILRTDLSGQPDFEEVVARVRKVALEAFEHQDLPFERVVEELRPRREPGKQPLSQILFVLQIAGAQDLRLPGLALRPFKLERRSAAFDLLLNLREGEQGLTGTLEYKTDLFEPQTVRELLARYRNLLEGAVHEPRRPISSLPLSQPAEDDAASLGGFLDNFNEAL